MAANMKESHWTCDHCNSTIMHGAFRFNCTICDNYDFCEECAAKVDPPHPHRMMRELAYGDAETVEGWSEVNLTTGIQLAATMYCDRHCLGVRDIDITNPSLYADTYSWLTYETVCLRSKNFGQGLRDLIEPRGYLVICANNRPEWVITDFACILHSIISVPIYCLFNDREVSFVLNNTKVSIVVCDKQMLPRFIRLSAECPSLRHIVCMDSISELIPDMENSDLRIHCMSDIETFGSTNQYDLVLNKPDECLTIIYTSGSTGFPKGAMVSENTYLANLSQWCCSTSSDYINFCYEPLAWASERDGVLRTFFRGGRTGFSTGDLSLLMEDLALVRPTNFAAPPTIWNKLYAEFKTALSLATAHLSSEAIAVEETRLRQQFSKLIPTRCKMIIVGGAMVSPAILNFIKQCFSRCHIFESYGLTECGSVSFNNVIENSVLFRLISVPEMGYTIEDKPFARGELVTKTVGMISGYINNPEETQAAFTEDGYFRTGDIVELRPGSNEQNLLYIIDRKKNFFKLSQGQFVSPEFLQSIYIESPFVEQIYIHGDFLADSVAAVIVPNREYAQAFATKYNLENFDINNPDPIFYNAVRQDLCLIAEKESLRKHEIPSRLILDFQPFTPENGLLTSTMKPCRRKLASYYADRFKQSYTVEQQLKTIFERTTGQSLLANDEDNAFIPTGGDSLTAIRLSRIIENDLGVTIPLHILLEPTMTLQQLATVIKHPSKISSMSHSIVSQLLNDSQLDLNITVGGYKSTVGSPSRIFVTGTTGFVGAFLLAELLLVYPVDCKFVCLVRCSSTMNPLDRIREKMLFFQIWKDDFRHRILALEGDLSKPRFGLDMETYELLTKQVDIIFHCGAMVNFILPYNSLFDANVCGTREIIHLATYTSLYRPIHYISTVSVLSAGVNHETTIDHISPDGLVNGYAQSKWVAEKLMTRASHLGVPVVIYRLGSICASTQTGACNPNDLYTLLFAAMMTIKSYPETLFHARLYGLPVDFTAKSIVYLSNLQGNVYGNVYHVLNPMNDLLFEDIIDTISQCGVHMECISLEKWQIRLKTVSDQDHLFQFIGELLDGSSFKEKCPIFAERFSSCVSSLDHPCLDEMYLKRWLSFILEKLAHH